MKIIKRLLCSLLLASTCGINVMAQENQSYILHTIEKGQSLYSIASMYGVNQSEIIRLNPGSDKTIYIGHTLRIPRKSDNTQTETFHTILPGETLYRLTIKYGISAKDICQANPGLSAENFRTGQVIRIPAKTQSNRQTDETSGTPTVVSDIPDPVQSRCREMHKVKRKETIYSISRKYKISEAELMAANPELKRLGKDKLKKGSLLCIPYPAAVSDPKAEKPSHMPTNSELFTESRKESKKIKTIKAAVILPFLGVSQTESSRMIEYYEGFLLAVDSLKKNGTSVDLYTYNSGSEKYGLHPILNRSELKTMDIIFGPAYQEHIAPLAQFTQKNNIRLVIPFTSKDNEVFKNPSIYQINTPQSYLYSEVYEHFVRQFPKSNVIFIETAQKSHEKTEFIKGLKETMRQHNITGKSVSENATAESIIPLLKKDMANIFIPTSSSNFTLVKILPQLTLLARTQSEYAIQLFGYPEWQTYTQDHLEAFFELDTYFYSSFYTNNLLPAAVNFTKKYRHCYGKDMNDRYPKYGMLGFDTGYYFLKGLSRYGTDFEKKMQKLDVIPIQTGFKFQRVNNWGGFINRKVFFVHFSKNYELIKLDFD